MKTLDEYESKEVKDAEGVLSDAEILINQKLRKGRVDEERARRIVEEQIEEVIGTLRMNSEEADEVSRAALDGMSIPFEFERTGRRRVIERWEGRQKEERAAKLARTESFLKQHWAVVDDAVERVISLDQILAAASLMERYTLTIPAIGNDGLAFVNGRNLFLMRDQLQGGSRAVQSVSYALGRTKSMKMEVAKPRNVVMLTGANSGGKTTLLTTLASVHVLTLLGLPVPCEKAEVTPMPIYLFRRRVTRKIGSLEQALSSLIPVFADRHRKLVLMDEFEALTEPGAAGRILAGIVNAVATSSSLLLLVTHLARETLPHVKLPIRVDGIEAEGLDKDGELIVDRQPKFNHIGSSTPKLIIMKLAKSAKKDDKALYGDILSSLEGESSMPVQTPLSLPWLSKEEDS
jgi:DNA mismatch repair protein MutS2